MFDAPVPVPYTHGMVRAAWRAVWTAVWTARWPAMAMAALAASVPGAHAQSESEHQAAGSELSSRNVAAGHLLMAQQQFLAEADFGAARASLRAALAAADLEIAIAAEALRYLAALELAEGNTAAARERALAALRLDGVREAPPGTGDLRGLLAELADQVPAVTELRLRVRHGRVDLELQQPPGHLITDLELRCADQVVHGAPGENLSIRAAGAVQCFGAARTAAGATLLRAERTFTTPAVPAAATEDPSHGALVGSQPTDDTTGGLSRGQRIGIGVGAAGLAILVAVIVGIAVASSSPQDDGRIGIRVEGWP